MKAVNARWAKWRAEHSGQGLSTPSRDREEGSEAIGGASAAARGGKPSTPLPTTRSRSAGRALPAYATRRIGGKKIATKEKFYRAVKIRPAAPRLE